MSKKIITVLFAATLFAFGITACQPKDSTDVEGTTTTTTETETDVDSSATDTSGDASTTNSDIAVPAENTDSTQQ